MPDTTKDSVALVRGISVVTCVKIWERFLVQREIWYYPNQTLQNSIDVQTRSRNVSLKRKRVKTLLF